MNLDSLSCSAKILGKSLQIPNLMKPKNDKATVEDEVWHCLRNFVLVNYHRNKGKK